MTKWQASCDELIAAGWGEHSREDIPSDWRTNHGTDPIPGEPNIARRAEKVRVKKRRETWQERRAVWLAAHGRTEESVFSRANGDNLIAAGDSAGVE